MTTAYLIAKDKTVTDLGAYQRVYEARKVCDMQAGEVLKWVKPSHGTWESVSGDALFRLVTRTK